MKKCRTFWVFLSVLWPSLVYGHLGSPDVFYDGMIGPYPAQVTIRMPAVVPGRAQIIVRVQTISPVTVSVVPLSSKTAVSNAPPAEPAEAARGESNLYSGELWLMTVGGYSIEVKVHGPAGDGAVQIPVNSVATRQLPLPPFLGQLLTVLGIILFCGGIAIVAAAASEAAIPPGTTEGGVERSRRWRAISITTVIFVALLIGGKRWWRFDENEFRKRLRDGGWPDLTANVRIDHGQRILDLTIGRKEFGPHEYIGLAPDHGKLLHLFLVRLPNHDAFGHIHPVRTNDDFAVALPPLPEGNYEVLCDLTLEDTSVSSTATNVVHVPANQSSTMSRQVLAADPDDSWAASDTNAVSDQPGKDAVCQLAKGWQMVWKAHPALTTNENAFLQFEVRDEAGQPVALEPYMGMMSHVAVLRDDGRVFDHLHPSGNFSMAAQMLFDAKIQKENGMPAGMDHSKMHHHHPADGSSTISLPYEFPEPGKYRLWVQVKSEGEILTGIFDTTVK